MNYPTTMGSVGVALLLVAFVLNQAGRLKSDSLPYLSLNVCGAGVACYASWLIEFVPFVVLEAAWAMAALAGIVARLRGLRGV